jgi:hypothetical protein
VSEPVIKITDQVKPGSSERSSGVQQGKDLADQQGEEVVYGETYTSATLDQLGLQQQQQRFQGAIVSAIVTTVVDTSELELLRERTLRAQLEELAAVIAQEKKRSQRNSQSDTQGVIFEKLTPVLGAATTEQLVRISQRLAHDYVRCQAKDQKAVVEKALAAITSVFAASERCKELGITPQRIQQALVENIQEAQNANRKVIKQITDTAVASSRNLENLVVSPKTVTHKELSQQSTGVALQREAPAARDTIADNLRTQQRQPEVRSQQTHPEQVRGAISHESATPQSSVQRHKETSVAAPSVSQDPTQGSHSHNEVPDQTERHVAQRLLNLVRDTETPSSSLARTIITCLEGCEPEVLLRVRTELERLTGQPLTGDIHSFIVSEATRLRGVTGAECTSLGFVKDFYEAANLADSATACEKDLAIFAAMCLRLELLSTEIDPQRIASILLASPQADGAAPSDEEMAKWAKLVVSVYRTQTANNESADPHLLEQVLADSTDTSIQALSQLVASENPSAHQEPPDSEIHVQRAASEAVTYIAVRSARAQGELQALMQQEGNPARKALLAERIKEEKERLAALAIDPDLIRLPNIEATQSATTEPHPLQGEYVLAAERIKQHTSEVRAYVRLVEEAELDPDAVLEDLSRRFACHESGKLFRDAFRREHGYDVFDVLIRSSVGAIRWDSLSVAERTSLKSRLLNESAVWRARERAFEATIAADSHEYLRSALEIALLQDDAAAFLRLQSTCSVLPAGMIAEVEERLQKQGLSLEQLIGEHLQGREATSHAAISSGLIAQWIRAQRDRNVSQAEAIELRTLMAHVSNHGTHSALEAQALIEFLTRDGFGAAAQRRLERISSEYRALFSTTVDLVSEFRRRAAQGGEAPTWPNDFEVIDAILRGDLRGAEKAAVERAVYLRSNVQVQDGMAATIVMPHELNRLAQLIAPERLAQIEAELSAAIKANPEWAKRGVTSLSGYISFCSGPEWGAVTCQLVDAIMHSRGRGLPQAVLQTYTARLEALKRGLHDADEVRSHLMHTSSSFDQTVLSGARSNYRSSQRTYSESGGPIYWAMGYTAAAHSQMERDAQTLKQAEQLGARLVSALDRYGAQPLMEFRDNVWVVQTNTTMPGQRAQIVSNAELSLRALLEGNESLAARHFEEAVSFVRRQLDPTRGGLSAAMSEQGAFFKDAISRARESGVAFDSAVKACDTTITVLQTTRTVVFVGGAVIATGGLGAGALVTTVALSGISLASHAVEGGGYYARGLKDGQSATRDALYGAGRDASRIMTGATVGAFGRWAVHYGPAFTQAAGRAVLNIGRDTRMHVSAIREVGVRRWMRTRVVELVAKDGGKTVYRRALIEPTKEISSKFGNIAATKNLATRSNAVGKFVGDVQKVRDTRLGEGMKWILKPAVPKPPIPISPPIFTPLEQQKPAPPEDLKRPEDDPKKYPNQVFFGSQPSVPSHIAPIVNPVPAVKAEDADPVSKEQGASAKSFGGIFALLNSLFGASESKGGSDGARGPDIPPMPPFVPGSSKPGDAPSAPPPPPPSPSSSSLSSGPGIAPVSDNQVNSYVAQLMREGWHALDRSLGDLKRNVQAVQDRIADISAADAVEAGVMQGIPKRESHKQVLTLIEQGAASVHSFVQMVREDSISSSVLVRLPEHLRQEHVAKVDTSLREAEALVVRLATAATAVGVEAQQIDRTIAISRELQTSRAVPQPHGEYVSHVHTLRSAVAQPQLDQRASALAGFDTTRQQYATSTQPVQVPTTAALAGETSELLRSSQASPAATTPSRYFRANVEQIEISMHRKEQSADLKNSGGAMGFLARKSQELSSGDKLSQAAVMKEVALRATSHEADQEQQVQSRDQQQGNEAAQVLGDKETYASQPVSLSEKGQVQPPQPQSGSREAQGAPVLSVQQQERERVQSNSSFSALDEQLEESLVTESPRGKKSRRRGAMSKQEQERLRGIIMQQLLMQTFERSKREKLLRMLASLGLTEQEYRNFLSRLTTVEASRQEQEKQPKLEAVMQVEQPFAKPVAPTFRSEKKSETQKAAPHNRGDLYARLKKEDA